MTSAPPIRLSVCIATLNRARYIGETLDAILPQMTAEVELVVVDGASRDETPEVMARYAASHPNVRYHRERENSGVDADFDKAVSYARGEYCWLMSDDDLIVPGAVARVLQSIGDSPQVLIVNARIEDRDMGAVLNPRQLDVQEDRRYAAADHERFFIEAGSYLSFIGGVVVDRAWWQSRERAAYHGSLFIHMGVLFQQPAPALVKIIAQPLVRVRYGNAQWTPRAFEIWIFKWPSLVWSFVHFGESARGQVSRRYPGARLRTLLWYRGMGAWGPAQWQKARAVAGRRAFHFLAPLIARLPVRMLNAALAAYCGLSRHGLGLCKIPEFRAGIRAMQLYDLSQAADASALARRLATRFRSRETEI